MNNELEQGSDPKQKLREFAPNPVEWMTTIRTLLFTLGMKEEMSNWGGSLDGWGAAFEWIKYHVKGHREASIKLAAALERVKVLEKASGLSCELHGCSSPRCNTEQFVKDVTKMYEELDSLKAERDAALERVGKLEDEVKTGEEMIEALGNKYSGCPHQNDTTCACSYDHKNDLCMVHSPRLLAMTIERNALLGKVAALEAQCLPK